MNAHGEIVRMRLLFYGMWIILSVALFWRPFLALVRFAFANDDASHTVLIPFIGAWLVYVAQKQIFQRISFDYPLSGILFTISAIAYIWTRRFAASLAPTALLTGYALTLVIVWIAGFVLFFGREASKQARFSLLFLFLAIPIPDALLSRLIYLLQKGSADIAQVIFDLAGVPALREGFVFHLAHVNIEVAKECSGIRSSMALLIMALVVGHLFLRSFWKQAVFVIAGLLIMLVKNGIRIATLTILASYVDPGFLYGRLHHEGGVVFFLIGLGLLLPVYWLLRRGEAPPSPASSEVSPT